jgi:glycyl-tRNA synthetase
MPHTFQSIIFKLQEFWAAQGCLIAQPYYTQVGAGTMNPATFLRVLGPEPWKAGYVEPSVRPDDGRYGENPNRLQMHYQYQVVLKPDPGNPVELYMQSLEALGIDPRAHDIRLVEDNWEQLAISAWGLGWEIWLDGQEITQFTYFQQVGGQSLDPVAVEITYGLDRILIALNNAAAIWDEPWNETIKYGEVRRQEEYEHSKYYYEVADVDRLRQMYDLYRQEAEACLAQGLVVPAHDYLLKCSHAFGSMDARGAIGVAERQASFSQMRDIARRVSLAYLEQRKELEYPLLKEKAPASIPPSPSGDSSASPAVTIAAAPSPFLLEVGVEELPATDLDSALAQLRQRLPAWLDDLHLEHGPISISGTPRRLVVFVETLAPRQPDREDLVKGPPAERAFGPDGVPTPAAVGFAKSKGLSPKDLEVRTVEGGKYAFAVVKQAGLPAVEVLAAALPALVAGIKFEKSMRWNASNVAFSRPLRWFVALFGETVVPFEYAGLRSGSLTRGLRPFGSPAITISSAAGYIDTLKNNSIILDVEERRSMIEAGVKKLAASVKGKAILPAELLAEVANLVEFPTPLLGSFDQDYLALPNDVLISVMKKHQRYFPVMRDTGAADMDLHPVLLPYFIIIRNGDSQHLDLVVQGNEHVLRARFADANFFVREDIKHKLEDYRPRLSALIFQKKLGSVLDKSDRIEKLTPALSRMLGLEGDEAVFALRAAHLAKADLATRMVVEMTSLQGIMGREYALRSGEAPAVAEAIGEQYRPIPRTKPGLVVALADRLDSLVSLFSAGLAPTGTRDPFGLRRAAIGVVQPLIEHAVSFDLASAVKSTAALVPLPVDQVIASQVLDFLAGRLRVVLLEAGYKYDIVDAVLAEQANDPAGAARAIKQLAAWVERKDWNIILPAYARCVRILRSQPDDLSSVSVDESLLLEPAERALYEACQTHVQRRPTSVNEFLSMVEKLIPAINAFFDKVLVMAEDQALKRNRLALLQKVAGLASGIADLGKLEGF